MAAEDQRVRQELAQSGALFEGYHPRMRAVHDRHAARMATILDDHGWPGEGRVGTEGAWAAWLIVQHAIASPVLQRRALGALETAAAQNQVPACQPVMLEDRIRTLEGRPQRYGTQFDWDETGVLNPLPIEDPDGLDARRRAVGLAPLEEAIRQRRRETAESGERPPKDWWSRRREMERWLQATGWRE